MGSTLPASRQNVSAAGYTSQNETTPESAIRRWKGRLSHHRGVDRPPVKVALGLAEGVARGDPDADALLVDGFDSVEQAACAHAYLSGFLLELLAHHRSEDIVTTVKYVRTVLDS